MAEPEWKTPAILDAEAQVSRSVEQVRELAEKLEREGLPTLPEPDPDPEPKVKKDDDGEDIIVLRHSSW